MKNSELISGSEERISLKLLEDILDDFYRSLAHLKYKK
jgi:hypothetical protein